VSVKCYNGGLEDCKLSYTDVVGRDAHFGIHAALVLCPSCIPEKVVCKSKMIFLSEIRDYSNRTHPAEGHQTNHDSENLGVL
jgi:hypothetical protein